MTVGTLMRTISRIKELEKLERLSREKPDDWTFDMYDQGELDRLLSIELKEVEWSED